MPWPSVSKGLVPSSCFMRPFAPCFASAGDGQPVYLRTTSSADTAETSAMRLVLKNLRSLARLRGDCAVKHDAPELPFAIRLPFENPKVLETHFLNLTARP